MSKRLDQLPTNTLSSDCIIYGEENSTTSVKIPVNAANGLAGLDGNGLLPIANLPIRRGFGFFLG